MEKWNKSKIKDFAEVKGGKRLPKGKQLITTPNNHPYIRIKDLGKSKYLQLNSEYEYVDDDTQKTISKYIVNEGDILISVVGTIGLVGIVGNTLDKANQTENCDKIINIKGLDLEYLYYYLISDFGQEEIRKGVVGAVQPKLPLKNVRDIMVKYPSKKTQNKIVAILSSIDEKIELNNKINNNLYVQARAITKQCILENEGRYKMIPLVDIASINPDTYSPKEQWEYVNYLDTSSITDGYISEIQHIIPSSEKLPSRARRKIIPNDIVYSTVRPNQKHFGIIYKPVKNLLCSTGFAVIRSKTPTVCNELIYLYLTETTFIEKMQQLAEQSVSTFPSIKSSDLGTCEIPCLEESISISLTSKLKSIFSLIMVNHQENISLVEMRNTLLPKLMSGELSVSDIEF